MRWVRWICGARAKAESKEGGLSTNADNGGGFTLNGSNSLYRYSEGMGEDVGEEEKGSLHSDI